MVLSKLLVSSKSLRPSPAKLMSMLRFLLRLSSDANRHTIFLTTFSVVLALIWACRRSKMTSTTASMISLLGNFLHRRRRRFPPGPTNYPLVGILPLLDSSNPGKSVLDMSKKYGTVFYGRLGGFDAIFLNDYESIKEAFTKSGDTFSDRPRMAVFESYGKGRGLVCCHYDNNWKEQRRFMFKLLRDFGMGRTDNLLEDRIAQEVVFLSEGIAGMEGKSFDPHTLMTMAVSNITCTLTFGKRYDYYDGEFAKFCSALNGISQSADIAGPTNYFSFMEYLPFSSLWTMKAYARRLHDGLFTREQDAHTRAFNAKDCRDVIDFFLKEVRENESKAGHGEVVMTGFKEEHLPSLVGDLFAAGTDTTACSMNWLLLLSIKYPQHQERIQDDLDKVVGRGRLPRQSDKTNLPFVTAMMAESLRFAAGGPFGVPHAAIEDTTFRGYEVPKGTMLIANHYALLFDPEFFPDPEEFNPHRFLDQDGHLIKKLVERTNSQFGIGRRACIGEKLAQSERFIFYTNLLHQFTFSAPNGPDSVSLDSHFGLSRSPYPFKLRAQRRPLSGS